ALAARVPSDKPDFMMPIFIIEYLPHGIIGLLLVAILAAAMSSLSSAVNSLAAVTLEDLAVLGKKPKDKRGEVVWARWVSIFWGVIILVLSSFAGAIAPTVIEAINKVGSALYGPILGVFLLGMLTRRVGGTAANAGLIVGLGFNLYLWLAQPQVFWMWWNFIGLVVTLAVAAIVNLVTKPAPAAAEPAAVDPATVASSAVVLRYTTALVAIFVVIVVVSVILKDSRSWFIS
ncbi:MAG: sodium transporter, partial [Pseudomonadota bacterium]